MIRELKCVIRGLIEVAATIKGQQPPACHFLVCACFDIGMEGGYIAPICRGLECINDLAKEVIDNPVDIHMKSADLLERLNVERKDEAVLLQFGLDPVIDFEQDAVALLWLCDGGC
jgi:hypothetical protein